MIFAVVFSGATPQYRTKGLECFISVNTQQNINLNVILYYLL